VRAVSRRPILGLLAPADHCFQTAEVCERGLGLGSLGPDRYVERVGRRGWRAEKRHRRRAEPEGRDDESEERHRAHEVAESHFASAPCPVKGSGFSATVSLALRAPQGWRG
jgi:hypothetical protein